MNPSFDPPFFLFFFLSSCLRPRVLRLIEMPPAKKTRSKGKVPVKDPPAATPSPPRGEPDLRIEQEKTKQQMIELKKLELLDKKRTRTGRGSKRREPTPEDEYDSRSENDDAAGDHGDPEFNELLRRTEREFSRQTADIMEELEESIDQTGPASKRAFTKLQRNAEAGLTDVIHDARQVNLALADIASAKDDEKRQRAITKVSSLLSTTARGSCSAIQGVVSAAKALAVALASAPVTRGPAQQPTAEQRCFRCWRSKHRADMCTYPKRSQEDAEAEDGTPPGTYDYVARMRARSATRPRPRSRSRSRSRLREPRGRRSPDRHRDPPRAQDRDRGRDRDRDGRSDRDRR